MLEEEIQVWIDTIHMTNKTISICIQTIIKRDGVEIARDNHRTAYGPGDIEAVKVCLGVQESPEITYLNTIWTPEVITAYQQSLEE